MVNIAGASRRAHSRFEVPVTVQRPCAQARPESAVLFPDEVFREPPMSIGAHERVSFNVDVSTGCFPDIKQGDVIVCSDSRIVAAETAWCVVDRAPMNDDGLIQTWWVTRYTPAAEQFYNATITIRDGSNVDTNGDPLFNRAVTVDCWIDSASSLLDRVGYEHADDTIIATLEREFLTSDLVWLPDDEVNLSPKFGRKFRRVWSERRGGHRVYLGEL